MGLYATLPLFNLHAFLFVSIVLAIVFFCGRGHVTERRSLQLVILAFLPAAFFAWLVTSGFEAGSLLRWLPGWMQGDEGAWFWVRNFGFWLPLVVWLSLCLLWWRPGSVPNFDVHGRFVSPAILPPGEPPPPDQTAADAWMRAAGAFTLPALLVFLACAFISFAPWEWDNTKLLIWSYLTIAPFLWSIVIAPQPAALRVILCIGLFFSGALALAAGLDQRHGYKLADRAELDAVTSILRPLAPEARVAAAPSYEHPALLAGQAVVMGYDGHLWSHGHRYAGVERDLTVLMTGAPGWQDAARRLNARYLFWGRREQQKYAGSTLPWTGCARALATSRHGVLYDLSECLK